MEIVATINEKDNTTTKMNINMNKLVIIISTTMVFDM